MKHRGEILVCEDDPGLLALTRDILEADGHRVDVASSPRQALALLEERPYDLLLADGRRGQILVRETQPEEGGRVRVEFTGVGQFPH